MVKYMGKIDRYFKQTSSMITAIVFIALGTLLLVFNNRFYFTSVDILTFVFLILGVKDFILYFFRKEKKDGKTFRNSLFHLVFALIFSAYPKIPYSILPIIIGIYFLINAVLQSIDLFIIIKNHDQGKIYKITYVLFYLFIAFFLIFRPLKNIITLLQILGIYFIAMGIRFMVDTIFTFIPVRYKNRIKRKIRISLPVIIECLIPYVVLSEINASLQVDQKKIVYEEKKNDENPDLEVIIHVSNNGFNRMGHVDIIFDQEVISYGNYDKNSMKFHELFGDGVIFITEKEKYIPFCIEHSKKTLFIFGLKLSDLQKSRVKSEIDSIKKDLIRWRPPLELDCISKNAQQKDYTDYSSCLYKKTKAKFYKVNSGNFQTYFVLGNNCCRLADRIIGKSGIDLLKMNGFITPGSYYEYLNREFMRKGSFVVSKNIYNKKRKRSHYERKKVRS